MYYMYWFTEILDILLFWNIPRLYPPTIFSVPTTTFPPPYIPQIVLNSEFPPGINYISQ